MFFDGCDETVSILYAAIFGAGEACVDLSMPSLITAFAVFIFLVVVAQLIARRLWARLTLPAPMHEHDEAEEDMGVSPNSEPLGRGDTESPIRPSRF